MFSLRIFKKSFYMLIICILIAEFAGCGSYFSDGGGSEPEPGIEPGADSNAYLSDLSVSAGILSPDFDREIFSYTIDLSNKTSSITVTPSAESPNASIIVNDESVISGTESKSISLNVGANTISIIVTAGDNQTTKTYTIMAGRGDLARWGTAIWGESLWNP